MVSIAPLQDVTRFDKKYPDMGTAPVPVGPCISPEYFELERERVFRRSWLYLCREEHLPSRGSYITKDFEVCNASVVVARGDDGRIRGFHNLCQHRGNRLVCGETTGSCRAFTCGFHGWTFRLDGSLATVPAEDQFFDFDRSDYGLSPVAVDVWDGFVFVHLDPEPETDLGSYLGDLGRDLNGYPFSSMTSWYSYGAEFNTNWKVAMDAFQEFYHVAFIHRRSLGGTVKSKSNPFSNALDITLYPLHRRFSGYGNPEYQPTPTEMKAFAAGMSIAKDFMAEAGTVKAAELPPGVNPTRSTTWSFDVNVVFPNTIIDILNGAYFVQEFWPLAYDRVRWEINIYFPPISSASERFSREHSKVELRDSILEDLATLERTQASLKSGVLRNFVLQDNEMCIRHAHRVVDQLVRSGLAPGGA